MSAERFVTFYSYKGGVGRTQALANTAVRLAAQGRSVVMVDMDLESPGLHTFFFQPPDEQGHLRPLDDSTLAGPDREGVIELVERCAQQAETPPDVQALLVECTHPFVRHPQGRLRLLPAGRLDETYPARVAGFSWESFYNERHGAAYMEWIRQELLAAGDMVLLDSRTGTTDVGSIATFQLPDVLVVLFALHRQGIHGARRLAEAVLARSSPEGEPARLRRVLLVPSRVDEQGEIDLREQWLAEARLHLEGLADVGEGGPRVTLLLDARLRYEPRVAFGEQVLDPQLPERGLFEDYEKLVGVIRARSDDEDAVPAAQAHPRWGLPQLLEWTASAREQLESLGRQLELLLRDTGSPLMVARRALSLASECRRVADELQAREMAVAQLLSNLGSQAEAAALHGTDPTDLRALRGRLERLERLASRAKEAISDLLDRFGRDLERAAGGESAPPAVLKQLAITLALGAMAEATDYLEAERAKLERESLSARLATGTLTPDLLEARLPEPGARRKWLEAKLGALLEAMQPLPGIASAHEPLAPEVRLALQLSWLLEHLVLLPDLSGEQEELGETHWTAWSLVCYEFRNDKDRDQEAFKRVGRSLWERAWRRALESPTPSWSTALPPSPDALDQLDRLMTMPGVIDGFRIWLTDAIAARLGSLEEAESAELLRGMARARRNDPVMKRALLTLGAHEVGRRFALQATALLMRDSGWERDSSRALLNALIQQGAVVEAFRVLIAGHLSQDEGRIEGGDAALVVIHFIARLATEGRWSELERAVSASTLWECLIAEEAGRAVLVFLGGGWWLTQEWTISLRSRLAHSAPLPDWARGWMRDAEKREPLTLLKGTELEEAVSAVRQHAEHAHFHSTWYGGVYFQNHFRHRWQDMLDRLLEDTRPTDVVVRELEAMNAEQEIGAALRAIARPNVQAPVGPGRVSMIADLEKQHQRFVDLARLGPPDGRPSLRVRLEGAARGRQIHDEWREWWRKLSRDDPRLPQVDVWEELSGRGTHE